jgi:hypothetical protein
MKKLILVLFLSIIVFAANSYAENVNQILSKPVNYSAFLKLKKLVKENAPFTVKDLRELLRNFNGYGSVGNAGAGGFNAIGGKMQANETTAYNAGNYLGRNNFLHEKQLALFVGGLLKKYKRLDLTVNKQGRHYQTAVYIAAARQMPHVVYMMIKSGWVNPAITSLTKNGTYSYEDIEEYYTSGGGAVETKTFQMPNGHAAYPVQVYNVDLNSVMSAAVYRLLRGMSMYALWCPAITTSYGIGGECWDSVRFPSGGGNEFKVFLPRRGFPPLNPTPNANPYKKYKPAHLINIPVSAPFWDTATLKMWGSHLVIQNNK